MAGQHADQAISVSLIRVINWLILSCIIQYQYPSYLLYSHIFSSLLLLVVLTVSLHHLLYTSTAPPRLHVLLSDASDHVLSFPLLFSYSVVSSFSLTAPLLLPSTTAHPCHHLSSIINTRPLLLHLLFMNLRIAS